MTIFRRAATCTAALALLSLAVPKAALAHQLTERYQAPLPLVVYVIGAALAVAMSFVFVIVRNAPNRTSEGDRSYTVPEWLRTLLSAIGLIGWLWIVVQTLFGGSGSADVASLFLWVYGWVGVALISALIGPAWAWIDPFTTLHRLMGAIGNRLGVSGEPADYPERLHRSPAVIGFIVVIWLELVAFVEGGRPLGLILIAYTVVTLAGMSYFGREQWRAKAEVFTVWFGLLGRLAPYALEGEPEDGRVRRRSFGAGLLAIDWSVDELLLVALGTGAIIFDGLSQTQIYFDLFAGMDLLGLPALLRDTIIAAAFLGVLVVVVLIVARMLSVSALGAGLLPVAVGYLIAHYLTYLLIDGQRIVAAINDPLVRGWNLLPFDLAFYEPAPFLPAAVVWSIQLAAVVGGHVVGAWAGHAALAEEGRSAPAQQVPLAALMVVLTSVTLWSLGQAVLAPQTA